MLWEGHPCPEALKQMPEAHTFLTRVVTRAAELFHGEVVSAVIPGAEGYFGVLADHAPLIATLGIGEVTLTMPDGHKHFLAVTGGVVEVRDNELVILADIGERAEDIDVSRAQEAADRARVRLHREGAEERVDITRADVALTRALNRVRVARHGR